MGTLFCGAREHNTQFKYEYRTLARANIILDIYRTRARANMILNKYRTLARANTILNITAHFTTECANKPYIPHALTCSRTHALTHRCAHTHTHTHTHTYRETHTRTHQHTHIHTLTHTHAHADTFCDTRYAHCNTPQRTVADCNTLQWNATHCTYYHIQQALLKTYEHILNPTLTY